MAHSIDSQSIRDQLNSLDATNTQYASLFVEHLLDAACRFRASDVHLQPNADKLNIRWRLDGVLQAIGEFDKGQAADIVTRLKVLAKLLTYHSEVPQEGRLTHSHSDVEMRVSTFPTIFGERVVVRLFAAAQGLKRIEELGLSDPISGKLLECLAETTGAILITGPAGSGKTTTAYACLRHLTEVAQGGRSIVTLEDPVEVALPGVAQSQVNAANDFDIHSGLRSLLRQDPEVILVGEIRDRETAIVAFQAALTGQLLLTTFHAGSAAEAVNRLVDMGIEPYLLRSGILAILHQRLIRMLCHCAEWSENEADRLGLPVARTKVAKGCESCQQTGYAGRTLIAELLCPRDLVGGRELLSQIETQNIELAAIASGMKTRWDVALQFVASGVASAAEVRRVLGFGTPGNQS